MSGPEGSRGDRLEAGLADRGLDALLVSDPYDIRYLTGFTGTNALVVIGAGGVRRFFTDFRYVEQAAAEVSGFERLRGRQDLLADAAEHLSGRVGFDDAHLTVRAHRRLGEAAGERAELLPAAGSVGELRAVKEPGEIEAIRAAAAVIDEVLALVPEQGLVGRTERAVALALDQAMRDRGAEGPSFPTIVAGGAHGALPHASPRAEPIETGALVIIDLGCVVDGYCSDCTRTFATGAVGDEATAVYELVLGAQEAALAAIRPGADARGIDAVAREAITAGGHGERFGHGLGHGVGLEVHEGPRLSPAAAEGETLAAGNVVTVEPGVYVPGAFGVRIEDLVVVGEGGAERLSRYPKGLIEVG